MSRATPPVALSFREFLVKILKPENDGVLELVKNVSCNPNSWLIPSRKQSELLEVGLKASHVPLDNGVLHCFSQARWVILLCLIQPVRSYRLGWYLGPAGRSAKECLGCENPSTSTRTLSTLTLVGDHLEDDESSFEVAVFKGPAEPLGALLEGATEPLDHFVGIGGTPRSRFGGIG